MKETIYKGAILVMCFLILGLLVFNMFFQRREQIVDPAEIELLRQKIRLDSIKFERRQDSLKAQILIAQQNVKIIRRDKEVSYEKYKRLLDSTLSRRYLDSLRRSNRDRGRQRYLTAGGDTLRNLF